MEELLAKVLIRLKELSDEKWTGQVVVEINMTQGSPGSVYFSAKENISVKKK